MCMSIINYDVIIVDIYYYYYYCRNTLLSPKRMALLVLSFTLSPSQLFAFLPNRVESTILDSYPNKSQLGILKHSDFANET